MHYQDVKLEDMLNGEGVRVSLFVSGCIHGCKGCFSEDTWDPRSGHQFTPDTVDAILDALPRHDGLSLLGGDPMHPRNREAIVLLCALAKQEFPQKDIWMWTGFEFEELKQICPEILDYVDVIIDGKYEQGNMTTKPFRGSDNQVMWKKDLEGWYEAG